MMRRTALLATLVLFVAASASAQVAIYLTSSSAHVSNVETGSVLTGSGYQDQYTGFWTSGIGGGVTLSALPLGPVSLGFDLRGSTRPGTNGVDTGMGGLKLGFHLPAIHLKPYVEASGGYLATRSINISTNPANPSQIVGGTISHHYAAWEILGGIDYPLARLVDFRVIEFGGGTGYNTNSNVSLFTINTGVVVHF